MGWSEKDLLVLKNKGFKIDNQKSNNESFTNKFFYQNEEAKKTPKNKIQIKKISEEKATINLYLKQMMQCGLIKEFVCEYQFSNKKKYRFDWYIPEFRIGIEYEGIISEKSRHTTIEGYSNDIIKYNLATQLGYVLFRYCALNYESFYKDIEFYINNNFKK